MERKLVRIGTSGWVYWSWRGRFYPQDMPQREWLRYYCARYITVELNCTFYRLPTERAVRSWTALAGPGFVYAVKGSRYITHRLLLRGVEEALSQFIERVTLLGPHLGPLLWQLPPSFEQDKEALQGFLQLLPAGFHHAFEFRHLSWYDDAILDMLAAQGHVLCLHDWGRRPWPKELTARWSYIRLHSGSGPAGAYSEQELRSWANWLGEALQSNLDQAYVYFNNDAMANAITNSQTLIAMLEELCPGVVLTPAAHSPGQAEG